MQVLVFYGLILIGFLLAHAAFRAAGVAARIVLFIVGAAVLVATAMHFGRDLHRASDILRYGLSAVALASGVLIVAGRRPVHCALALLVVFACLAGIFVSWQAEFLAAITISINAGAVIVTFLFILMLIDVRGAAGAAGFRGWNVAALTLAVVLAALIVVGLERRGGRPVDRPPDPWFRLAGSAYGAEVQNTRLKGPPPEGVDPHHWLNTVPPEEIEQMKTGRPYPLRPISGFTTHLGWELYTKYTVPFEVASLILTVAVVGAVVIGRQGRRDELHGGP